MEKLGIIGCGIMGHSIALSAAWAGLPVTLHGIDRTETDKAQSAIMDKLQMLFANQLLEVDMIEPIGQRIHITHSIDEVTYDSEKTFPASRGRSHPDGRRARPGKK